MDGLRHAVHSAYLKVAEAAMPPLSQSKFEEKRVRSARAFWRRFARRLSWCCCVRKLSLICARN
jgi:hypothetical protein